MPTVTISPNMNLPVPIVGVTIGPEWASDLNNCLSLVDLHDHSPGQGVQITPSGIDINSSLSYNNQLAIALKGVSFTAQGSPLSNLATLSVSGVDLYYTDGAGNVIRVTQSGSIVGPSGTITGLVSPASATYVAGDATFVWQSGAGIPANMDFGSAIFRSITPPYHGVIVAAPVALGADYNLVLPANLPATQSFMTLDASGNMAAPWTVDNNTIIISSNQLKVNSANLGLLNSHQFEANGPYRIGTFVDGAMFFKANSTITNIWIYNLGAGISGTTEFDLKVASPGGSFATICTTTGKITSAAAANIWTDLNSIVGPQTGVTKIVLSSATVLAGQALRFDLITTMVGANNCGVIVEYLPT